MVRIAREEGLRDPEFIQDEIFRAVIYRPYVVTAEVANGAIDGATNQTKKRLVILLMAIFKDEGKRIPVYMEATKLAGYQNPLKVLQLNIEEQIKNYRILPNMIIANEVMI